MGIMKVFCKCLICKQKGGLKYTRAHGNYGEAGFWQGYHKKCLKLVCDDPESYTHIQVDAALKIKELLHYWEKRNRDVIIRTKESCKRLKAMCQEKNI